MAKEKLSREQQLRDNDTHRRKYQENHSYWRAAKNKYASEHRDEINKGKRKWYAKNQKAQRQNKNSYYYKKRHEVFVVYGGNEPTCQCCGEKELGCLTIDHINNDGQEDNRKNTLAVNLRMLKEKNLKKYQVLCFNCNFMKFRYGACLHKHPEKSPWRRYGIVKDKPDEATIPTVDVDVDK